MTSLRPYREALSAEEALDYLQVGVGTLFDGACVDAFLRACARGSIETENERKLREQHAAA